MEVSLPKQVSFWLDASPDIKKFPTLKTDLKSDVVIVGGGMVGVSVAVYLANRGVSVILLEKNHIASGDTALSTGFLTRVPDTSLSGIRRMYGADFLRDILEIGRTTQKELFHRIKECNLECGFTKTESYFGAYQASDPVFAAEVEALEGIDAGALVYQSPVGSFVRAIKFLQEGKCDARKLLHAILEQEKNNPNLAVYEETEVLSIVVSDSGVVAHTPQGLVEAGRVIVATGLPHSSFTETRGLVREKISYVITARYRSAPPIPDALFWDTASPYFYYRLVTPTMLMLGGCDAFVGVFEDSVRKDPYRELQLFLKSRLPGDHEVVQNWSGSLFETKDGLPYAFEHPEYLGRVFIGCGLAGNGLVLGMALAHTLGDMVQGKKTRATELFSLDRTGEVLPRVEQAKEKETVRQKVFVRAALLADIAEGKPYCTELGEHTIALFLIGGRYYAINNICSHAGGPLCKGALKGSVIQCPIHGAQFNVKTGAVVGPPAVRPQLTYPVRVRGEAVEVEVEMDVPKDQAVSPDHAEVARERRFSLSWLRRFF